MARAARIALDLALVSLNIVRPTVSKIWGVAKSAIINTPAKPLICNTVVTRIETALDQIAGLLVFKMTALRDRQLPKEEKYLEKELEKVRKKMNSDNCNSCRGDGQPSSKALRPTLGHAWQYAKTEVAPPMTLGFFHGPRGKAMENSVSKFADGFIAGIESKINEMDAEKLRNVKEKDVAVKAAQETAKAAANTKEDDRKREEEQKKKQAEKAAREKAKKEKKLEPKAEKQSATIKEVEKKSEKKSNNKS